MPYTFSGQRIQNIVASMIHTINILRWSVKVGDLVKVVSWLGDIGGKIGIVAHINNKYCPDAKVLFDTGIVILRLYNLRLLNECR